VSDMRIKHHQRLYSIMMAVLLWW